MSQNDKDDAFASGRDPKALNRIERFETFDTHPSKDVADMYDLDNAILSAQGHEAELERSFSWLGAVGLAFRYKL